MADRPDNTRPTLLQLLEELDHLEQEQRTLDLRDPRAVEECQKKIDLLRRKILLLDI
jgi:hypothetical protein